jgi:hypothetical protein
VVNDQLERAVEELKNILASGAEKT